MAQERYLEFKEDDATFTFNRKLIQGMSPGIYAGYDFVASADLNMVLNQATTGLEEVELGGSQTAKKSLAITQQGTVIKENAALASLAIGAGHATLNRIDTIYVQHEYTAIPGGTVATYGVIAGTPGASPSAPALTIPLKQIKIAELYIPATTTQLDDVGVAYSKENPPHVGYDDVPTLGSKPARVVGKLNNRFQTQNQEYQYIGDNAYTVGGSNLVDLITPAIAAQAYDIIMDTDDLHYLPDLPEGTEITLVIGAATDTDANKRWIVPGQGSAPANYKAIYHDRRIAAVVDQTIVLRRLKPSANGSSTVSDGWHVVGGTDTPHAWIYLDSNGIGLSYLDVWVDKFGGIERLKFRKLGTGIMQMRGNVGRSDATDGDQVIITELPPWTYPEERVHSIPAQVLDAAFRSTVVGLVYNNGGNLFLNDNEGAANTGKLAGLDAANLFVRIDIEYQGTTTFA